MMKTSENPFVQQVTIDLCRALQFNINKNLHSVSFEGEGAWALSIRIIFLEYTDLEKELMTDTLSEWKHYYTQNKGFNWQIVDYKDQPQPLHYWGYLKHGIDPALTS